jgi:hypothetical protein
MATNQQAPTEQHGGHTRTIVVSVNGRDVRFEDQHVTGLEIKSTAIAQGVAIQEDFALFEVRGGGVLQAIGDTDRVTLHPRQRFRAVAPDDNS